MAFIHAQKANRRGDVLIEGIIGVQKEAVLAAKRAVVTVEEIVDDFDGVASATSASCRTGRSTRSCRSPGGAHPSYTHGYYSATTPHISNGTAISADRDLLHPRGCSENVLDATPDDFRRNA